MDQRTKAQLSETRRWRRRAPRRGAGEAPPQQRRALPPQLGSLRSNLDAQQTLNQRGCKKRKETPKGWFLRLPVCADLVLKFHFA